MISPFLLSAAGGLVSSLFGPKPKYTEGQKMQLEAARRMRDYSQSVPGSDPQEAAALAQMRGQLGAEQGMATNQILGAMPNYARTNQTDLMRNLAGSQASERGALDLQAMMDWINQRRQAVLGTAQIAGSVGPPTVRQNNVPQLMGQLAQLYAQNQAMKQPHPAGGGGPAQPATGWGSDLTTLTPPQTPGGLQPPHYPTSGDWGARNLFPSVRTPSPAEDAAFGNGGVTVPLIGQSVASTPLQPMGAGAGGTQDLGIGSAQPGSVQAPPLTPMGIPGAALNLANYGASAAPWGALPNAQNMASTAMNILGRRTRRPLR